jgi:hypothetical protein
MKKLLQIGSIFAILGGAVYFVVMSIMDAFKEVDFDFSDEEDDEYNI